MSEKRIYSKKELREIGYTRRQVDALATHERFSEYGFRQGSGRTAKVFFILPKMERIIEILTDEGKGICE